MPTTRGGRSQDGVTNLERTDYLNNGVVEGGKLYEEDDLPGCGRSRGHGGDRAACRRAGENVQQVVQQAQEYMQTPEGQAALDQAQASLQEARANVQQAVQQFQKAREGAQEKMQEVTSKVEQTMEQIPKSGGPPVASIFLPAAALLVGSGVLMYAVLRRR